MKVNFKKPLLSLDGKVLKEETINEEGTVSHKDILISSSVINALMASYKEDRDCSGEDLLNRFELSKKIKDAKGEVEMTLDDIAFIRKYVKKAGFAPLVYARINQVLAASSPKK